MDIEKVYKINDLLGQVNRKINKRMPTKIGLNKMNPSAFMILVNLLDGPPKTLKEISFEVQLANSTVSGIIDRLLNDGYVERKIDEKDRRRVLISLSDYAHQKRDEIEDMYRNRVEGLLKGSRNEDLDTVIAGLDKLVDILKGC